MIFFNDNLPAIFYYTDTNIEYIILINYRLGFGFIKLSSLSVNNI